jgi:hypothetical protein
MKTWIYAQHFHTTKNAKTNTMHETHKILHTIVKCVEILNHQSDLRLYLIHIIFQTPFTHQLIWNKSQTIKF